uniref:SCP domain-containing protein n=1 Tax=Parascaris univalens TaxID=6257 RepID=A0A915C7W6_PARUN
MLRAINSWWDEIKKYNAGKNPDNIMDNAVLSVAGHWSQVLYKPFETDLWTLRDNNFQQSYFVVLTQSSLSIHPPQNHY